MPLRTSEVFGLRTKLSDYSYVDRGNLDSQVARLATRDQHIALKGESKSGKSWLRQRAFPDAVVVQCRIDHTLDKIYTDVLRELGISRIKTGELSGREITFGASAEASGGLLATAAARLGIDYRNQGQKTFVEIGGGADDLPFVVEIVKNSGRKVVIEDFFYLDDECRAALAQDLKALWDLGVYIVIVGIWRHMNYLTYLNPDLSGRMTEVSLYWSNDDLASSLLKGAESLNCSVADALVARLVQDSYGNIGLLQSLALAFFEESGVEAFQEDPKTLADPSNAEAAEMIFAE